MRAIANSLLWLGHRGDVRDLSMILDAGIQTIIDLADNEPVLPLTRDLVYCRYPLRDGAGNPIWLLQSAITCVESMLRLSVPTLMVCSAGMSRSPLIAAAGLAKWNNGTLKEGIQTVQQSGPMDISPGLMQDVAALFN